MIDKRMFEDSKLSLRAKGFLGFCLSKPDNWEFHTKHLAIALSITLEMCNNILTECIDLGYAIRDQNRKQDGRFGEFDIVVSDSKSHIEEIKKMLPEQDFPDTAKPDTANPPHTNKEKEAYRKTTTTPTPSPQVEKRGASAPVEVVVFYECLREVAISDEQKLSLTAQFSEASVVKAVMYATHPCTVIKKTLMDCLAWACLHPEKVTIPEDRPPCAIDPKKLSEINRKKALQVIKDYQSKASEMRFKIYEDGHQFFIKFTPIAYDDPRFNEMVERYLKEAKLK